MASPRLSVRSVAHAHAHPHSSGAASAMASTAPGAGSSLGVPPAIAALSASLAGATGGGGTRHVVSPLTFLLFLLVVAAFFWTAQPRRSTGPGADPVSRALLGAGAGAGEVASLAPVALSDPEVEGSRGEDSLARVVRLDLRKTHSLDPRQDQRGWMVDPLDAAQKQGLEGGATSCLVTHLGEVLPGKMRGNHRHHLYNETLVLWGAKMRLRNENKDAARGYGEVVLGPTEVALLAGPAKHAHAISNIDPDHRVAYLMACQDGVHDPKDPHTDYKVWPDLL